MYEVEVKIPQEELLTVKTNLKNLGGIMIGSHIETDIYYNHPCKDFSVTDEALRVRIVDGIPQLTYKGPKMSLKPKTRLEINIQLNNGKSMNEVLVKLGFTEVTTITKNREEWRIGTTNVFFDEVKDLGNFIEIEREVDNQEKIQEAEKEIIKLITLLYLNLDSSINKSYLELLLGRKRDN